MRDVASELKVEFSKADSTSAIEEKVLATLVEKLAEQAEPEKPSEQWLVVEPGAAQYLLHFFAWAIRQVGVGGSRRQPAGYGRVSGCGGHAVALPLTAVGAVGAGVWAFNNKKRPELQGLTTIVVHYIARIRAGVVAADHEDFANRLRACL